MGRRAGPLRGGLGGGVQRLLEAFLGQAMAGLDVGGGVVVGRGEAVQPAERLDLADHFPAGGAGIEQLPEKAFEGQPQGIAALAAVGALVGGGEQVGGDELGELLAQLGEGALAQGLGGAAAQGGQWGAPGREAGGVYRAVYIPPY